MRKNIRYVQAAGGNRSRGRFFASVVGCIIAYTFVGSQSSLASPDAADASRQVDVLFARYAEGVQPGAAVMVIRNGKIVHQAGYGYAALEQRRPITADSAFRLASVSKQFSAMAVMVLADEGKLSYDDPVRRWLPELAPYEGLTVRHMLTHTGGLPEYYDVIDTSSGMPTNADALKLLGEIGKPVFKPGERWEYSNPAFDMLPPLVKAVSGQDFATFMHERVFVPAGMETAVIFDETEPEIGNRVIGYEPDGDGFQRNDYDALNHIVGSGGMYATLKDFYHWDQALYGDSIVSQAQIDAAYTPMLLNDGESTNYGFGWRIEEYKGRRCVRHGGSWVGFRTHIARFPDDRFTVVILSNRADFDAGSYVGPIADIYLGSVAP